MRMSSLYFCGQCEARASLIGLNEKKLHGQREGIAWRAPLAISSVRGQNQR